MRKNLLFGLLCLALSYGGFRLCFWLYPTEPTTNTSMLHGILLISLSIVLLVVGVALIGCWLQDLYNRL